RRRLSAHTAVLPLSRLVRARDAGPRGARCLHPCARRDRDVVTRARQDRIVETYARPACHAAAGLYERARPARRRTWRRGVGGKRGGGRGFWGGRGGGGWVV